MSDLQQLIDLGVLDADFATASEDPAIVMPSSPEVEEEEEEEIDVDVIDFARDTRTRHVPAWTQRRQNSVTAANLFNQRARRNNDGDEEEETFEHKENSQRRKFNDTVDDVVDTSDDEEEEVVDDKHHYYRTVKYHWLYSGGRGPGWWHYPEKDNDRLERKYQSGKDRTKIKVGDHTMIVDFNDMTQKSGSSSRNILRIETLKDLYLKGVAGERITKEDLLKNPNEVVNEVVNDDEEIPELEEPEIEEPEPEPEITVAPAPMPAEKEGLDAWSHIKD